MCRLVVVMQLDCLPFLFVQPALGETEFSGVKEWLSAEG